MWSGVGDLAPARASICPRYASASSPHALAGKSASPHAGWYWLLSNKFVREAELLETVVAICSSRAACCPIECSAFKERWSSSAAGSGSATLIRRMVPPELLCFQTRAAEPPLRGDT
jgi:hypothetical protein